LQLIFNTLEPGQHCSCLECETPSLLIRIESLQQILHEQYPSFSKSVATCAGGVITLPSSFTRLVQNARGSSINTQFGFFLFSAFSRVDFPEKNKEESRTVTRRRIWVLTSSNIAFKANQQWHGATSRWCIRYGDSSSIRNYLAKPS
jgi:hypothetical protein